MNELSVNKLKKELAGFADKKHAAAVQRFFKTGKGEYGEGDTFIGIKVPVLRATAKKYENISIDDTLALLTSEIHEHRLTALIILNLQYNRSDDDSRGKIIRAYMKYVPRYINNWDLVDLSAPYFVGDYYYRNKAKRKRLYRYAKSRSLWKRRTAIMTTFYFIKKGEYEDTLNIVEILMNDKHDLIHKAAGWMLREIGKRIDEKIEKQFLDRYLEYMPRTMLRYAIEKFSDRERERYLGKR